jgi:hypothetical protein
MRISISDFFSFFAPELSQANRMFADGTFLISLLAVAALTPALAALTDVNLATFSSGNFGFKFIGQTTNDELGSKVNQAGDFNGDGLADVIVVAPYKTVLSRTSAGAAYVLFGKAGSSPFSTVHSSNFTTSATTGFKIYGAAANDWIFGVSGIGDYNNDGITDLVVCSPFADPSGRVDAGTVYVIYGRITGIADIDLLTFTASATNGFKMLGARYADRVGYSAKGLGDFNGDGYADFTTYSDEGDRLGNDDVGFVYVFFGSARSTDLDLLSFTAGSSGFRIYGFWGEGNAPYSIGDVNNDGFDDIGVNNFLGTYAGRSQCGALFVYFGHSASSGAFADLRMDLFTTGTAGFRIYGTSVAENVGLSSNSAGDFNGDGLKDLIVGSSSSKMYIIFGRRGVTTYVDIDLATYFDTANRGQVLVASGSYGSGCDSGPLGDFDGDGISDIYLAYNGYQSNKGAVVVLFGHRNTTASFASLNLETMSATQGIRIYGAVTGDQFGLGAANAGDMNGDGAPDLIAAARFADPYGQSSAGVVYVLYGQGQPTASPTAQPSSWPSSKPSRQPTSCPSCQPTSQPSSQPSTQPSINPATMQSILASPTYKVRNGFAFAAIGAGGKAQAWGEAQYGGDASVVQSQLQSGVAAVVASRFAFAAAMADGSLALWGVNTSVSGLPRYGFLSYSVTSLVGNEAAFAGVDTSTGRVIAVGSKHHGGNVLDDAYCNGYSAQLSAGVRSITASKGAFAAIKTDNTLLCWGNQHAGANIAAGALSALVGAKMVVATMSAFAVLLSDNTVASWGDRWTGGDSSAVASQLREVHHLTASRSCFVAFRKSSGVVVWGYGKYGGDTSAVAAALSSHVTQVAHTFTAIAALKADGTVVAWGLEDAGGDASAMQASLHGVTRIYANAKSFALLTSAGGVAAWGHASYGGAIPSDKVTALSSGVVSISHTDRAFAALKSDGSVVVWGQAGHGGSPGAAVEALLTSGVHTICANDVAFSAIKTDGSVVAWGHSVSVPTAGVQFTSSSLAATAQCA